MKKVQIAGLAGNRRTFLKGAGMAGLGMAGATLLGSKLGLKTPPVDAASSYSEAEILNFALNLEYLEAEFYAMSTYGATLVQLGVIKSSDETGPTTGGQKVTDFGTEATWATALRVDEIAHVKYLRAALGSEAVKKPAINLNALGYGFSGIQSWLKLARQFEDVGVSAYLGAAPLISSSTYLGAAGAILATEAQHSGAVRDACIRWGVSSPAVDSHDAPPHNPETIRGRCKCPQHLQNCRAGAQNRLWRGTCSGGFYPAGMNGAIVCS